MEGIVGQEFYNRVTRADGTIAIFTLEDGWMLMLYQRANLAKDASLPPGPPTPPSSAWVSHSFRPRLTGCSPGPNRRRATPGLAPAWRAGREVDSGTPG
jgi:hypothetical protein